MFTFLHFIHMHLCFVFFFLKKKVFWIARWIFHEDCYFSVYFIWILRCLCLGGGVLFVFSFFLFIVHRFVVKFSLSAMPKACLWECFQAACSTFLFPSLYITVLASYLKETGHLLRHFFHLLQTSCPLKGDF